MTSIRPKSEPWCAQEHESRRNTLEEQLLGARGAYRVVIHRQLGELCQDWFLDGIEALHHFQDAYQLRPEPALLARARAVYRQLGRLPLVEKLLRLELHLVGDPHEQAPTWRELGDVLMDMGRPGEAAASYARAVAGGEPAGFLLEDAQVPAEEWPVHVGRLLQQAEAAGDLAEKSETLLRAAGIAAAFSQRDAERLQRRAYEASPLSERASALFEGSHVETNRTGELVQVQQRLLEACRENPAKRGTLAFRFGARWAQRHNPAIAIPLLLSALRDDVDHRPAVTYLYKVSRTDPSLDEVLVALAEEQSDRFSRDMRPGHEAGGGLSYLLASAALVAARDLNNIDGARSLGERLSQVDPSHPALGQLIDRSVSAGN